jgi:exonuclease VII small subunit
VNLESIVQELEEERDRLNEAIAALQGSKRTVRKAKGATNKRGRRLSAAGRKRISQSMKRRWAARKRAGKNRL